MLSKLSALMVPKINLMHI